ncbi:MAG: hypothetical protein M1814_000726 [Vezdaea aestivalis]|nr:MAG: hypothetical protein M1814_000726 [Vezdaea aestivalis]
MDGGSEDIENDAESIASSDPLDGLEGSYRTLDSGDEKSSMDQSYGSVSDLSADMTDNLARQEHRFDPTISAFLSGPQKCGTQCTNFRCADRGRGCKCLAAPNKAQRGTWQMYGCAMAIASGRGRRSVDSGVPNGDWACPCNASYVSHSCCDADGGVVWEDPLNKLGVLA